MSMLPTATPMHSTFLSWNLTLFLIWSTLVERGSFWLTSVGNLLALLRPGPRRRGICLITESDARKPWYFLASFFTSFLSLFSFFRSSTDMASNPSDLASSQWRASPSVHRRSLGRGTYGSLTVPEKRLSFCGS